jgi:pimeloyl-ACP methyl ester carboxylesterase
MISQVEIQYYTWKKYNCAYTNYNLDPSNSNLALLLIHPIGVGLSGIFWQRFIDCWLKNGYENPIYNPDLLGCGNSDLPHLAYYPDDWAEQLKYFIETVVKKPVILVVQGGLFPVAIRLVAKNPQPDLIQGLVLSGPPGGSIITKAANHRISELIWNLFFDSFLGAIFYRYARRRQFLQSFSVRQLFAEAEAVDNQWLDSLEKGAANSKTRHAVFSFLAGFWRQNYQKSIQNIQQPTLVLVGEKASNISQADSPETPEQRLEFYLKNLPNGQGRKIPGRNVLPYESTNEFVSVVADFVKQFKI